MLPARRLLAEQAAPLARAQVVGAIRASTAAECRAVGVREVHRSCADLVAEVFGAGAVLREVWSDPEVTDVLVNNPTQVWVDRGEGLERVVCDVGDVRRLATRLAAAAGQRLDDAAPIVDGRLPDGSRLNAILAPIAAGGAVISLRRHRPRALGLQEWRRSGGIGPVGDRVLRALVSTRANLLISGGTGTGKTTLLAALLGQVPDDERLVCIEEARELEPLHPHVVHLQSRAANVQGAGAVTLSELVRTAMRMRPDRLVLGECRGSEVRDVLLALNTGHDGGMATVHANAATEIPARLTALGSLAGLGASAVAVQAVSAFDAVVHLGRQAGCRVVEQVAVLRLAGERLEAHLALRRHADSGDLVPEPAWGLLAERLDRRTS